MGAVYSAEDMILERDVALKFLHHHLAQDRRARERLMEEAKAASALDHPNICRIHGVDLTPEGQMFISMARYQGATVGELLEGGPLPSETALDIALQVAKGLEEAHARGIVHRDIKPANLIVTEDGGVTKILDFGIAKREDLGLTRDGGAPGTGPYMSPEQLRGEGVDGKTDVWSLGVVLYEMLTGAKPFNATNRETVAARIMYDTPSGLRKRAGAIPADLRRLITSCLEKDPSRRLSAAQVRKKLEPAPPTLGTFVRRRPRLAAGVAIGLLAIPVWLATPPGRRAVARLASPLVLAAPKYVAVLPFLSTDAGDAVLATGLTRSFTQLVRELTAGDGSIWVLPFNDMMEAEVSSPAEVRRVYPVDLVVTGELRSAGGDQSLELDLVDVRRDGSRIVSSLSVPWPSDSLSIESAQTLMGRALGLPAPSGSSDGPSVLARATSPAQRYYLLGVGQLQRAYNFGSVNAAIHHFETAIAEDASFGPAYAGLCEAFWELYLQTGEPSLPNDATAMCDQAVELSRSDPAALVALGRTEFFSGQLTRAERTLREAIQRNAGADAHRWLGHVLEDLGQLEEAERQHRQAIALRDDIWVYHAALGMLLMNSERHEEAIESHREVIRLSPDNYVGYHNLGASLMLMNRLDEAEEQFQRSLEVRPTALVYRNLGYLGLMRQRYDQAIVALQRAISLGPDDWWSWRWLAHAHHWRGESSQARESWQRVVELLEARLAFNPTNQDALCGMAEALVALGDTEAGLRHLDFLASLEFNRAYNLFWTGRIYEMLGSRRAALQYVTQALERGFNANTVANDPWLTQLRADPAYEGPR